MKQIIINFQQFDFAQRVGIYDLNDGTLISEIRVPTNSLASYIASSGINDVVLVGNYNYLSKVKRDLETRYSNDNIHVEIIRR